MAEGFFAAFGLGDNPGGLATGDVQGVALAAIQGLNAKLAAKERELAEVKATLALLAEQVERLARVTPADPSVAQSRRD